MQSTISNWARHIFSPFVVNDQAFESMAIEKASQHVSLLFGNVQSVNILKFFGRSTNLGFFLECTRQKKTTFSHLKNLLRQIASHRYLRSWKRSQGNVKLQTFFSRTAKALKNWSTASWQWNGPWLCWNSPCTNYLNRELSLLGQSQDFRLSKLFCCDTTQET